MYERADGRNPFGQGRRAAILTALGAAVLTVLVQLPLLAFGIISLLQAASVALDILRWGGAVYLAWIGAKLLVQSRSTAAPLAEARPVSNGAPIVQRMVPNLTNPKVLAFMLAFLPQFVDQRSGWSVTSQLFVLGLVGLGAGSLGGWLSERPHWIAWQKRFKGLVLIGLRIRLALDGDAHPVSS